MEAEHFVLTTFGKVAHKESEPTTLAIDEIKPLKNSALALLIVHIAMHCVKATLAAAW